MANYRIAIEEYLPIQKAVEAIYDNPPSHSDGLRVLVGTTPTGVFTGHTNDIAWSNEGTWFFDTPVSGWRVWVNSLEYELIYIDTEWVQSNTHITDGEYDDSAFLTGVTNLGSGTGIFDSLTGRTIQLRSIIGSGDTTVSLSGETILIHTDVPTTTYGTLNSTCTTALSTSASESFGSNICLHQISKTGCYSHLSGTPTIPTVNDGQLSISGGTVISGGGIFTANQSGNTSVTLNHDNVTCTPTNTAQTATFGGTFTAIDEITSSSQGHITGVRTKTVTLPTPTAPSNATICISAGTNLITGGDFTLNQSAGETITISHSAITTNSGTTAQTPSFGSTFTAIDSVTTNGGHLTCYRVKTVTLPTPTAPSDATICISGGTGLTGSCSFTLNQVGNTTVNLAHATYTARNVSATGANIISCLISDGLGHVTSATTRTLTAGDLGACTSIAHVHCVYNSAGAAQFSYPINGGIRVCGSGITTVGFDAGSCAVIINTPTQSTVNDGQLSISGGTLITGGGIFTANQAGNTSVTINHETLTTTTGTTAQTATHGGTITMIDAVTGNSGHITGVRNKTVTLPAAYSHPTGFGNQPSTALTNACVISQIGVTSEGHVSGVTSRNLTASDISAVTTTTFNSYTGTSQPILDSAVTGATNIGSGSQIYTSKSGRNLQLRSIVGSGDTTVTTVGNDIIVHTTIPADTNTYTTGVTVTGTTTKCLTLTLNNGSTVSTSFTDLDTNTVTRLRGTASGTYCSGDITICGGGDITASQTACNICLTYTHPTGGAMQPTTPLTNACVISQIGVNSLGHVTGHTSRNLTAADLGALTAVNLGPATATTYFEITNSAGTNACISGATNTYAGLVTTGNQLFAGVKCTNTFCGTISLLSPLVSGTTVCGNTAVCSATLVCGGTVRGGTICGTTISGGTVCGTTMRGGTICGTTISGSTTCGVSTISTCLRVTSGATTGYVLTSDASGNATWQAVPENDAVKKEITQASHGFSVGDVVGYSGTTYNKAIADGNYDGEILGIVSKVVSISIFELTQSGYVTGLTSLSQGSTYFLSPTTAGAITATEPTTNGQVSKAVLLANSTTTGWVLPYPGYLVSTGQTGALTGVTNLGDGIGVYDSTSANVARFRSILGSGDTTVTLSGGTIIVYTDAPDGSLSGLSDTTISSPIGGDLLYYSGDTWVNYTPDAFLNNICTSAPLCAGQILVYDSLNGYWCNTNGENCFIIHGSIEETGTTINGTGALSGTGTITYITSVGGTNPTTITISHLDTAGYKHIPSGGSTGQILCYGGSSGTATWGDAPSAVVNLGVTTAATTNTITNDSGGSNAILSGATSTAAGLVTNANQTWAGIKCTSTFCGTTSLLSPLVSGTTVCGVNASGFTNVIGTNICGTTLVSGVTTCGTNIRGGNISGTTISGATHIRSADISGGTVCGNTAVCSATLVCGGTIRGTTICGGTVSATTLTALTSMCSSSISGTTISGGTVCGATLRGATTCVGTIRISGGTPGAGKFLCSDASGNATWVNLPTASLSGLSDTTITSPSSGQVLSWNGSAWINCTSPAGVTTFTGLTDTPNGYTANTYVRVNSTGSALEYRSASNVLSDISAASSVHIHGNILNDGTIKGAVITPESGDTILLSDANNSNLIERGITIGTSATTYLANNGSWTVPAGTYSLPLAANGTRGGIQIGYSATGANIPLQLSSEKAYVALTKSAIESVLTGAITSHTHSYDNYSGWSFCAQGVTGTASIGACGTAIISGGTSITVARSLNCIGINHAAYTARNVSATGANIVSCVCVDATGHVTSATTRALSASDIGALTAVNLGVTTGTTAATITNDSGGSNAILSGATNLMAGLVTTTNQLWDGIKCADAFSATTISGNTHVKSALISGTTVCGSTLCGSGAGINIGTTSSRLVSTTTGGLLTTIPSTTYASSAHTHGNINNGGCIGTTSGCYLVTTTSGCITTATLPTIPTVNDTTITISAGTGLTTGGDFTLNQSSGETISLAHATYTARNVSATGANIVSCLISDGLGHVTSATTRTLTASDIGAQPAGTYDNYVNWCIAAAGVAGTYSVTSGGLICISGGTNVAIGRTNGTITINSTDTNTATAANNILKGSNSGTQIKYEPYASVEKAAGLLYSGTTTPTNNTRLNYDGNFHATQLYEGSTRVLTSESDPKGVASACFSGTTIKTLTITLNDASEINASFTDCNRLYSEISEANIIATASTATGLITGRRANYLLTQCGLTPTAISNWNTAYGWGNHANAGYASSIHFNAHTGCTSIHYPMSGISITTSQISNLASYTGFDTRYSQTAHTHTNLTNLLCLKVNSDSGTTINQGNDLCFSGGSNITIGRSGCIITISADDSTGISTLTGGGGICITGAGTSRTIATRIGNSLCYTVDGSNLKMDFNPAYGDARYSQTGHTHAQYLTSESDPKGVASACFSGTTTKTLTLTLNDASKINASFTDCNRLYSEISEANIITTASTTTGLITGRRAHYLLNQCGLTPTAISNWNTAYSWGNHATQGYLTTTPIETDPVFTNSPSYSITNTCISNWNTAYSIRHVAVTLGTANGLSLSGQTISLATVTTSVNGAMCAADKVKLNGIASNADNYGGFLLGDNSWGNCVCVSSGTAISLVGQGNITVTRDGNTFYFSGDSGTASVNLGVTTADTTNTITNSAGNNAILSGATASMAGLVTTGAQSWAGAKCTNSCFRAPTLCATTRFIATTSGVKFCGATTSCGVAGDWVATSDCRVKTNIYPISNALSTVIQLCGVNYNLCDDESNQNNVGLIAQDVEKVLPEIVSKNEPSEDDLKYGITDQKLGLKYDKLTAVLVEAIKEQQKQIEELKNKIEQIEKGI